MSQFWTYLFRLYHYRIFALYIRGGRGLKFLIINVLIDNSDILYTIKNYRQSAMVISNSKPEINISSHF